MSAISRVKLFELSEVAVVVREIEPVTCARKDQKIGERTGHTCRPSAISESDGAVPDRLHGAKTASEPRL